MSRQEVSTIVEEAAYTLVLPRLSRLASHDVHAKLTSGDHEDVVTAVDHEVEAHLTRALQALVPSAAVVGEEAAHQRPELLHALASDNPVWLIDPIDGTRNFADGNDGFGVMVSFVVDGDARAAWIVLPARRETFVAEAGGGAFMNGQRLRVAPARTVGRPRGALLTRYMPGTPDGEVRRAVGEHADIQQPSGCAAVEYTDIVKGTTEFAVYYRLLPWDHAAPALILSEAGGIVLHADGQPYRVRSENQVTVVARDAEVAQRVRMLIGGGV